QPIETSGTIVTFINIEPWGPDATLEECASAFQQAFPRTLAGMARHLEMKSQPVDAVLLTKASILNAQGNPAEAYKALEDLEARIKGPPLGASALYTVIYYRGVPARRMGETDTCVMCRGESACILPIAPSAVHTNPAGSRLAVKHFTDYLRQFPDDLEIKWL